MKALVETIPVMEDGRAPVGWRVVFLVLATVTVLLAQIPLASLAARVIG